MMDVILLAVLIIGGFVLFAICALAITRALIHNRTATSHNEVMVALFNGASVTYAVLLGFMVVVVWQAYDNAHRVLADEAAGLVTLYRLTYGMDGQEGAKMRKLIRGYTGAVISDEWKTFSHDSLGSDRTRKNLGDIDRLFAKMSAKTKAEDADVDAEVLKTKSDVIADRNIRLFEVGDPIPWIMWLGAFGGAAMVIVMSCFVDMENARPHFLMSGMMSALLGLLLFIAVVLSEPFSGPLPLSPRQFEQALVIMDSVDRGN
jgi:hypothetical protein